MRAERLVLRGMRFGVVCMVSVDGSGRGGQCPPRLCAPFIRFRGSIPLLSLLVAGYGFAGCGWVPGQWSGILTVRVTHRCVHHLPVDDSRCVLTGYIYINHLGKRLALVVRKMLRQLGSQCGVLGNFASTALSSQGQS